MSSIYIHIPFCRSKCAYCNFFSVTAKTMQNSVLESIKKELVLQKSFLNNEVVETIYFGGGTPSLVNVDDISDIINIITQNYSITENPEITLEANPDDLTSKYLSEIARCVNRLSIGIQSFIDEDLQLLGRKHSAERAKKTFYDARNAGFENISIDLIYGISDNLEHWEKSLQTALEFSPNHLSAYALTIEESTVLHKNIRQGKFTPISDEYIENQYILLIKILQKAGYEHYEISNFARENWQSRHNNGYWNGSKYLGVGPSAHSFNGDIRQWNTAHLKDFCSAIEQSKTASEFEVLSEIDKYNEFVMLNLRKKYGVNIQQLKEKFGETKFDFFYKNIRSFLTAGQVFETNGTFRLTERAFFISDNIIAALFL